MDKKSAQLGAFRKMMKDSAAAKTKIDETPEPSLKPAKGESQVQFEMLSKMLKKDREEADEDDIKSLNVLR